MQHLEGSGMPVPYIGRTVLKGLRLTDCCRIGSIEIMNSW